MLQEQQKLLNLHFIHEFHQSELKRRKLYQIRVLPSKKLNFTANSKPIGADFPAAGERRRLTASGRSSEKSGSEGERERCSVFSGEHSAQFPAGERECEREWERERACEHARPKASRVCVLASVWGLGLARTRRVCMCVCEEFVCICEGRVYGRVSGTCDLHVLRCTRIVCLRKRWMGGVTWMTLVYWLSGCQNN